MHVDVEDRDPLMPLPQMGGGDRAVVEKAEAPGLISIGMVAGRTAQRIALQLLV
jgi:hypothetical protein